VITLFLSGIVWGGQSQTVIWSDFDARSIPEPKERDVTLAETFFNAHAAERWKRGVDIPRWVRVITGQPKKAANVNALDEVPDSSWYTNRHALRHMTTEQLVRGPNRGNSPDFTHATVTKAKMEGVTPGLQLKDATGQSYLIKFDNAKFPELQSGAEVISTKILYAAGYNVPENYIAYLDPRTLEIKADFGEGKSKRPFTQDDLARMLQNSARGPDGRYRVLASKMLEGKAKGPFPYVGLRRDDPNDLIPHEHRRELRGLRVIASWINHWDLKETNTLDMYVEEGGRKFLRHHLIDFGSSLGGGKSPLEYYHGREYAFDTGNMIKELFTLGIYRTPDEKSTPMISPEVGIFSAEDFDPDEWKPSFRVMPFDNMTSQDAAWATRVILSLTEDDLEAIVKTAEYTNPRATDYILKTLVARRQMIVRHWLKDGSPLAAFAVEAGTDGVALKFSDLLAEHDLARGVPQYAYDVTTSGRRTEKKASDGPRILLGPAFDGEAEVRIWTTREGVASDPIVVHVQGKPGGRYAISRIERS
jgi:hypothetical protein